MERHWQRHYDYEVPTTIRYPRIPVQELLQLPVSAYPDKAALNFFGSEISYWELRGLIYRMANALGSLGIKKGDRVGIHLPNIPQYVISYYAALSLGGIVVNLNPMYTPHELTFMAKNVGMTTLITFDMVLPAVKALSKEVEIQRVIVTKPTDFIKGVPRSSASDLSLEPGWIHFSDLLEGCNVNKRPKVDVKPEDPALINFTGGTTGMPKGAVLTHANLVAATMQCALWGKATQQMYSVDRRYVMAVLPYFHVYGNIVVMNYSIFTTSTQILVPRFDVNEIMDIMSRFKEIYFFPAVPTMINAIINNPKAAELEIDKKIKLLNSGAAPMPVELIELAKDMGIYFSEGWGMTETTSLGISNPVLGLKKAGSIGIPFPDADVKLVDVEDGTEEVPQGEPGEIVIKSPLVMQGYWNNPEETAKQLKDGWLYTGDIATRDEDGYIYVVDRKKDMIIAGGYNIYPREVDEVLYSHPKVSEAVVVGITDQYRGETVKAYVVLKEGAEATEDEIIAYCREKLASYKSPKLVEFRAALPKTAVGKILRRVLREEEAAKNK